MLAKLVVSNNSTGRLGVTLVVYVFASLLIVVYTYSLTQHSRSVTYDVYCMHNYEL